MSLASDRSQNYLVLFIRQYLSSLLNDMLCLVYLSSYIGLGVEAQMLLGRAPRRTTRPGTFIAQFSARRSDGYLSRSISTMRTGAETLPSLMERISTIGHPVSYGDIITTHTGTPTVIFRNPCSSRRPVAELRRPSWACLTSPVYSSHHVRSSYKNASTR